MDNIKQKPIDFEEPPFTGDLIDRKSNAYVLTDLLSLNIPFVICVNASWGCGKTTFLRWWEKDIKETKGIHTIYFNAWENDFSDNALISLLGEISDSIDNLTNKSKEAKKKVDELIKLSFRLSRFGKEILLSQASKTLGVDIKELYEGDSKSGQKKIIEKQIQEYKEAKNSIQSFRKTLKELAMILNNDPKSKNPLVFIIDELDRCRPNYAIEILEKAKHLFNVENVVFVLGADKNQLRSSIKSIYGEGIDADGYLRKFIEIDYNLPPADTKKFMEQLFIKYGLKEKLTSGWNSTYHDLLHIFSKLSKICNLSLRDQEQCCQLFRLVIRAMERAMERGSIPYPLLLGFLIVLKIGDSNLYESFITHKISPGKLLDELKKKPGIKEILPDELSDNASPNLETYILACKLGLGDSARAEFDDYILNHPNQQIAQRIKSIVDNYRIPLEIGRSYYLLNYFQEKIDMVSKHL